MRRLLWVSAKSSWFQQPWIAVRAASALVQTLPTGYRIVRALRFELLILRRHSIERAVLTIHQIGGIKRRQTALAKCEYHYLMATSSKSRTPQC